MLLCMQIKEHNVYYETRKCMLIKISGDGAKYSRSATFCLLSFAFIRNNTIEDNLDEPRTSNDSANQSGLSSLGRKTASYVSKYN